MLRRPAPKLRRPLPAATTARWVAAALLAAALLGACSRPAPDVPPESPDPARRLVFYDWAGDMPSSVLEDFRAEFGVEVTYLTYQSTEEALEELRSGRVEADVAVLEDNYVATLVRQGKLAAIDFRRVPNFKHVSPNFRDLTSDPGNLHSVPYHYGTTGLLVRTDLVGDAVRRWADLWDPRYAGKVGLRDQAREVLGLTLLSLGRSLNTEDPRDVQRAAARLSEAQVPFLLVGVEASTAVPALLSGRVAILQGWAEDYRVAVEHNPAVRYVVPEDAPTLWSDCYVIPARSAQKATAEVFLNYLLRPEVSARIVNEKKYANANEAALALVSPDLRLDPVLFPPVALLQRADFYATLSEEGERLYRDAWARYKTTERNRTSRPGASGMVPAKKKG